jgi:hypothetical protein
MAFLTILILLSLARCSPETRTPESEASLPNHAPIVRFAKISPNPITRTGTTFVSIQAEDSDGDLVAFRYQWFVNGQPLNEQTNGTFPSDLVKRGDLVTVQVIPSDGKTNGLPYRTESVAVGNTMPRITSLLLEPSEPRAGDRLEAKVEGVDADQDVIEYRYRWLRNNMEISEGQDNTLETAGFLRGDTIVVEVIPYDGPNSRGKAVLAQPIALVNSPPRITSAPNATLRDGVYEYQVTAIDPDGDPLTFTLDSAPPGMRIDRTGRLDWKVPGGAKGTHSFRIYVNDSQGGFAFQDLEFVVSPITASAIPPSNAFH